MSNQDFYIPDSFLESIQQIVDLMNPLLESFQLIQEDAIKNISDAYTKALIPALKNVRQDVQIPPQFFESLNFCMSNILPKDASVKLDVNHFTSVCTPQLVNLIQHKTIETDYASDDYVTISKDSVREYNFPESIAIPIGNCRIRIKTDTFIAILSFLFSIILALLPLQKVTSAEDSNKVLHQILNTVDASHSSQQDFIMTFKEWLEKQDSESHDTSVQLPDSKLSQGNTGLTE